MIKVSIPLSCAATLTVSKRALRKWGTGTRHSNKARVCTAPGCARPEWRWPWLPSAAAAPGADWGARGMAQPRHSQPESHCCVWALSCSNHELKNAVSISVTSNNRWYWKCNGRVKKNVAIQETFKVAYRVSPASALPFPFQRFSNFLHFGCDECTSWERQRMKHYLHFYICNWYTKNSLWSSPAKREAEHLLPLLSQGLRDHRLASADCLSSCCCC